MHNSPAFCAGCGGKLKIIFADGRERPVCTNCGLIAYLNPLPCVAAVLVRDSRVLLVKRNIEPGLGEWGLPAGFMEWGETPENSLRREVLEETGLHCDSPRLLTVCSEIIEPYGHVVILGYTAHVNSGEPVPGDDAAEAEFFDLDSHPALAFVTHKQIMKTYLSGVSNPK
ncbi:NUDIX hydrolase [bacterium]|nr:NUDIX hydrolase [bacterium]MBU1637186.1 NUDIX hydrolase [bacterium]